jgi:hypothetical protein
MRLPRFIRLLIAYGFGDDDRRVPQIPAGLPPDVTSIVADNVRLLADYQDAEYSRLYMSRIGRFVDRRGVDDRMLSEISRLLGIRMAYEDLIWYSQQILAHLQSAQTTLPISDDWKQHPVSPTLADIVAMLPANIATSTLNALKRIGWLHKTVTVNLTGRTWRGRLAANVLSSLRRFRPQSVRYLQEKSLVERWLHMIDRALTKQPQAAWEVIETATSLRGHGSAYVQALANWRLVIDGLVKPTFDGHLPIDNLADHLARLRAVAITDSSTETLRREIAAIKAGLAYAA